MPRHFLKGVLGTIHSTHRPPTEAATDSNNSCCTVTIYHRYQKMSRLLRHMKHPQVRASGESALMTSAAAPSSGFAFVDNSQGASAAVAELSQSLGLAFEQIELEGENARQRAPRFGGNASAYIRSVVEVNRRSSSGSRCSAWTTKRPSIGIRD